MSWTGVCLLLYNDKDIGINYLSGVCQFLTCFYLKCMWNKKRGGGNGWGFILNRLCMVNSILYIDRSIISTDIIDRSILYFDRYYRSIDSNFHELYLKWGWGQCLPPHVVFKLLEERESICYCCCSETRYKVRFRS